MTLRDRLKRFRQRLARAAAAPTPVHIGTVPKGAIHNEQVPARVSPAMKPLEQTDEQRAHNSEIDQRWAAEKAKREQGLRDGTWRPQFVSVIVLDLQFHKDPEVRALFTEGRLKLPSQLTEAQVQALIDVGALEMGMGFEQRTANVTDYTPPQPPAPSDEQLAKLKEVRGLRALVREAEQPSARERMLEDAGLTDADLEAAANGDAELVEQLKAKRAELFANVDR